MTKVYYTCMFVPPELIAACGCEPVRQVPVMQNGSSLLSEGMCPFTQAWLETLKRQSDKFENFIAVFSTACDQMRKAYDLFSTQSPDAAFLLNVPSTMTDHSLTYYQSELSRLKDFLCSDAGTTFDKKRLCEFTSKIPKRSPCETSDGLKIATVGGPIPASIREHLATLLASCRATLVLEATEDKLTDHLQPLTPEQTEHKLLTELARRYFYIPAVWKRPNDALYTWFTDQVQQNHIDGVLLLRYVFCDLWHSCVYEFKKRLPVPFLEIDLNGSAELTASSVSRIQAFLETLSV